MRTKKLISEQVTYPDGLKLKVFFGEGAKPGEVAIRNGNFEATLSVETVLRIAEAIEKNDWQPRGMSTCDEHGFFDYRTHGYRCPECDAEKAAAQPEAVAP